MPICEPCGAAADRASRRERGELDNVHDPAICIDHGRTPEDIALNGRSCPCQHKPVGTATDRKDTGHA